MSPELRVLSGALYPPRLRDLRHPPPDVWLAGDLPRQQSVAIVGTRHPTEAGRAFARALAADITRAGIAVFSGGAMGIDTAAHEGALDAGGPTVVVAPSAFDRPFPEENAQLFERIVREGGGHLTRFSPGTASHKHHFHLRNAMLAALTDAVIVVETRVRGGARNTAAAARRLHRPVLVVPGPPWHDKGLGCVVELQIGGTPVGSLRDVLKALGRPVPRAPRVAPAGATPPLEEGPVPSGTVDPEVSAVRLALLESPTDLDELHIRTGIPVGRLRALLLTLTLDGVLVSSPSGQLSLSNT